MCRLAAYLGPSIPLRQFLLEPPHNLVRQSWAPAEMSEAALNADGFGLGWYITREKPATYLNTLPAWSDVNLESLADSLSMPLWLGYVRSATAGQMTGLANTQPFVDKHILYTHNGYVKDFNPAFKTRCHEQLDANILAGIKGSTDSEFLFAIIRQQLARNGAPGLQEYLFASLASMAEIIGDGSALLNFIITEGERLYAVRHAINADCPSLYYSVSDPAFPGGRLIASERLTTHSGWQPVPEHHVLVLDKTDKPALVAL